MRLLLKDLVLLQSKLGRNDIHPDVYTPYLARTWKGITWLSAATCSAYVNSTATFSIRLHLQ